MIEELFWGFNNFDNIGFALLTIFQVTTMDGWTVLMNIYENAGSRTFSWFYFIGCVIICSFFILNLTIA
jgi:voltage-dependent calcium channel L type alpha-1D